MRYRVYSRETPWHQGKNKTDKKQQTNKQTNKQKPHPTTTQFCSCCINLAFWPFSFFPQQEVRLHYVSSGSEDKPLMLLIHGFPEFWYSWRHQLKEFKHDYRSLQILFYFIAYGKWLIKIHVEFIGLFFKKLFQEMKERKKKGKR